MAVSARVGSEWRIRTVRRFGARLFPWRLVGLLEEPVLLTQPTNDLRRRPLDHDARVLDSDPGDADFDAEGLN